jgi:hypothetical protein
MSTEGESLLVRFHAMFRSGHLPYSTLDGLPGPPDSPAPADPLGFEDPPPGFPVAEQTRPL